MRSAIVSERLPRSGSAALAAGALVQAAVGAEFLLAGLNKLINPDYLVQFGGFVRSSPGAVSGPLAGVLQGLVVPNLELFANVARVTEFGGGLLLVVTALEVLRRRLAGAIGAAHAYEPGLALVSAAAAFSLGVMSFLIYAVQGGRLPMVNPGYAFASPIAVELLLVPLAFGIAWLEVARFRALR
jgi:hypothetical protein